MTSNVRTGQEASRSDTVAHLSPPGIGPAVSEHKWGRAYRRMWSVGAASELHHAGTDVNARGTHQ